MRLRSVRPLLAPLGAALAALVLAALPSLSADDAKAKPPSADLRAKVKALVDQLADKDPDKVDEAAALLLKAGPDALPFLPKPTDKLSDGQKKALAVVRKTLRDEQIKRDLTPRLVTIEGDLPLSKALAELAKQTGNQVEDMREADEDTKVRLKLKNVTFWEAIDTIAREADARVNVYERDKLALRRRPDGYVTPPTSYNGLFRTQVRRIEARRDLDSDQSRYVASLEIAWEPRFRPFVIDMRPQNFAFKDDKGRDQAAADDDPGNNNPNNKLAITGKFAQVFDVPLPSLERSAAKLGLLKGSISLIGPTRFETYAFSATLAEMQKDQRLREVTREGVTVKISKLDLAKDHWSLIVSLEYPADGPQFESFESWLVYNEMLLKNKDGKGEYPTTDYSLDDSGGNRAILSYHFVDNNREKLKRGDPGDWTPLYKAPGLIVEVPTTFEFKDIPLP